MVFETAVQREALMQSWLQSLFINQSITVTPVSGDASFRRYFRLSVGNRSFIVMDAPPEKEDCTAFIEIAKHFQESNVRFPEIYAQNSDAGFLLLSDFGDQQLLPLLVSDQVDHYYHQAMDTLRKMQHAGAALTLPRFDDGLYWREFSIFEEWYLGRHLQRDLSSQERMHLRAQYQLLIESADAQPQVFVHRDYHSRNLMVCKDNVLGILDFQDAVVGSLTYDLVSLLKDCYVAWPIEKVEAWVRDYYEKANLTVSFSTFLQWFEWMGLQRHLKCLGIFARLNYRDHKAGYLKEIPRVLTYALTVCDRYAELAFLGKLLR